MSSFFEVNLPSRNRFNVSVEQPADAKPAARLESTASTPIQSSGPVTADARLKYSDVVRGSTEAQKKECKASEQKTNRTSQSIKASTASGQNRKSDLDAQAGKKPHETGKGKEISKPFAFAAKFKAMIQENLANPEKELSKNQRKKEKLRAMAEAEGMSMTGFRKQLKSESVARKLADEEKLTRSSKRSVSSNSGCIHQGTDNTEPATAFRLAQYKSQSAMIAGNLGR
ncbi:hypothetical protein E8E13_010862 [Curvularia kusanoi]|uniref:Uncharacterized protein n=1 Tax=Curvularia kusanoi TaxID=90978 RepID=A0A9P4WD57_CURKU|nr:hypothetical protein E8E13_010862 [Curvularia kusanoi]